VAADATPAEAGATPEAAAEAAPAVPAPEAVPIAAAAVVAIADKPTAPIKTSGFDPERDAQRRVLARELLRSLSLPLDKLPKPRPPSRGIG
jgi:hypothetical protein